MPADSRPSANLDNLPDRVRRLGCHRYVAQGGDVGAGVTDAMGRIGPDGLAGIHTNLLVPALNDPASLPNSIDAPRTGASSGITGWSRHRTRARPHSSSARGRRCGPAAGRWESFEGRPREGCRFASGQHPGAQVGQEW
ncbi:hypothetical protein Acy02nite_57910 [Actinoplanes cyaneus]|uniref:Uncharacterized protein n=2 Tax=Actinoplanes cyaneus TaxID=52696 RepID=A0A919M343_9ACTN|nr:hypothetical protein Acy02nite_57910 [Actinoplanes cyaneus]